MAKWSADRTKIEAQEQAMSTYLRVIAGDLQATHKHNKRMALEAAYQTKLADDAIIEARNSGIFDEMANEENLADPGSHRASWDIEQRIRAEASWEPPQASPAYLGLPAGEPNALNPNPTTAGGPLLLSYDKVNALIGDKLSKARIDKQQGAMNAATIEEASSQANETIDNETEFIRLQNNRVAAHTRARSTETERPFQKAHRGFRLGGKEHFPDWQSPAITQAEAKPIQEP